jgi:hypothetical protein
MATATTNSFYMIDIRVFGAQPLFFNIPNTGLALQSIWSI